MARVVLILPTYGHHDFALRAARTFLEHTPDPAVVLVDDGSPDWNPDLWDLLRGPQLKVCRFNKNKGLTRGWNHGLRVAREMKAETVVAGNSDVLFPEGWFAAIEAVLAADPKSLVGPLTNAPGHRPRQTADRYWPKPKATDDMRYLAKLSRGLFAKYGTKTLPGPVNGFCMAARTAAWWAHAFDKDNVFDPSPKFRMTKNEDELQGRWKAARHPTRIVLGSFVLHFRGVSRGPKGISGQAGKGWFRPKG